MNKGAMARSVKGSQKGMTLVELITVIGIVGVLVGSLVPIVNEYRYKARYAIAVQALRDAFLTSGSAHSRETAPPSFNGFQQVQQGRVQDPSAAQLLEGYQNPEGAKISGDYTGACQDGGCQQLFLQVAHCKGKEYAQLVQFGDGSYVWVEHIGGAGCP